MDSMSRNVRLELILQILENYNRDDGITASEVVKIIEPKVSVSQRTILRDLRDLSLMHPICETTIEGKTYWRLVIDKTLKDQLNLRRLQLTEELIRILKLTAGSPNL